MNTPRPIPDTRTRVRFDWVTLAAWTVGTIISGFCLYGAWCVGRWM